MRKRKVITIAGMPGAGKGLVSEPGRAQGIPVLICGDVIREETKRRGLPLTPENMGTVMLAIRREEGPAVVAERLVPKIASSRAPVVIVEGVRSTAEVDALRRDHSVTMVAVHASPETRYKRLIKRGRSDDPKSWEEFRERDSRELGVGIGNAIALAQEMLVNEGSFQDMRVASKRVISKVTHK
jgi:dephospho-CoA kinase